LRFVPKPSRNVWPLGWYHESEAGVPEGGSSGWVETLRKRFRCVPETVRKGIDITSSTRILAVCGHPPGVRREGGRQFWISLEVRL